MTSTDVNALLEGADSIPSVVRSALDSEQPFVLLGLASSVMSSVDPRVTEIDEELDGVQLPTLEQVVETLLGTDIVELHVLVRTIGHLTRDRELARRIAQALPADLSGPAWLNRLEQIRALRAQRSADPLGESDTVVVELTGPDGSPWCVLTLLDHTLNGAVTDSFPAPLNLDDYGQYLQELPESAHLKTIPLDLAAARAGLKAGLDQGLWTSTKPDVSEVWPSSLPLLEYVIGQMPGDGVPWWSDKDEADGLAQQTLVDLLSSPHWVWPAAGPEAQCVQLLLDLHLEHFSHGVDRVSPTTVEIVLTDLWHTSFVGLDEATRDALPDVLRAWTRFVHERREVPVELTDETLSTIEELEPEFRSLAADEHRAIPVRAAWSVEIVDQVLDLAEPVMEDIGGIAARTALRRTVTRLLEADPHVLTRSKDPRRTAGALVVVVGAINELVGVPGGTPIAHVMRSLGLTTPLNDRVDALLAALGWRDRTQARDVILHPDLLTGTRRAQLIDQG